MCSGPRLKSCFLSIAPLLSWLPQFSLRKNAIGELIYIRNKCVIHAPTTSSSSVWSISVLLLCSHLLHIWNIDTSLWKLLLTALALAVVGYGFQASLGMMFAHKHGEPFHSDQELLAMGLCNSIGQMFQCFPVSGSMSRSTVQESTGAQTQSLTQGRAQWGGPVARATAPLPSSAEVPLSPIPPSPQLKLSVTAPLKSR